MSSMTFSPGDRPESAPESPTAEPTPAEPAAQQGVPSRGASHYAKGTAANMVRSMAVILAIVLAFFFITGRSNSRTPESLDVSGTAQHNAQQAGHPFAYPTDLPQGWVATSVRYEKSTGDAMTWNAGYTTPDEEYVSVRQTVDASDEWITVQTNEGDPTGTLTTEDGRDWTQRDSDAKEQRSLVHAPEAEGELTTVVTGTGSWEQLEGFADRLVEAETSASPAS